MTTPTQVYLSSAYATQKLNNSQLSDTLFYFTSPVVPPLGYAMTLKVLNASIPVSFTLVNSSNNKLTIGNTTYTVPAGNYNALTLRDELNTQFNSSYFVSYNSTTNKYTFSSLTADFTVKSSGSTCLGLIGFDDSTDTTSVSKSLTSTYCVDLSGDNIVYIDFVNLHTTNLSSSTGTRTSIVKSILNNVSYGSVLFVEDSGTSPVVLLEDHLSFLHVRLLGEDAVTLLDLSNVNWQMSLEIGFTPKQLQPSLHVPYQDLYQQYLQQLNL